MPTEINMEIVAIKNSTLKTISLTANENNLARSYKTYIVNVRANPYPYTFFLFIAITKDIITIANSINIETNCSIFILFITSSFLI